MVLENEKELISKSKIKKKSSTQSADDIIDTVSRIRETLKSSSEELKKNIEFLNKQVKDATSFKDRINEKIDIMLLRYINKELSEDDCLGVEEVINKYSDVENRYNQFLQISQELRETYSKKIRSPMPLKTKKLIDSYKIKNNLILFS